jgi:hypothetical protein
MTTRSGGSGGSGSHSGHMENRYLDMMTVRPSQGKITKSGDTHHSMLIEPILLPNLEHIHVDVSHSQTENCLFYPNGHKNRNMRKEIESTVKRHDEMPQEEKRRTSKYRTNPVDQYAHVKPKPLQFSRKMNDETADIIKSMKHTQGKLYGTTQIRL